jgi:hypothetical protein
LPSQLLVMTDFEVRCGLSVNPFRSLPQGTLDPPNSRKLRREAGAFADRPAPQPVRGEETYQRD